MPRYNSERRYGVQTVADASGTPTSGFVLKYEYLANGVETYLLFRTYARKLSANDKAAGFSPYTNYLVADLFTTQPDKARRDARKLVNERFGSGMKIKIIDKE